MHRRGRRSYRLWRLRRTPHREGGARSGSQQTRHEFESSRWRIGAYAAAVVLSQGLLDAFTTYGAGVAFLAPVSPQRWKSSWHQFTDLTSEVVLIWLPAVLMYLLWLRATIAARAPRAMQPDVR